MDTNPTTAEDAAAAALCSAGLSAPLAAVVAEAFREHDAAGRPPIVLAPAEDAIGEHLARATLQLPAIMDAPDLGDTGA